MRTKKCIISLLLVSLIFLGISLFNNNTKIKAVESKLNPKIEIYKNNISYSSEIYILYAVSYEDINIKDNEIELLFFDELQEEYIKGHESSFAKVEKISTIGNVNCAIFYSKGLAAKEMTKDIYARAYVSINGIDYYSEVDKFSVLEYVYKMKEEGSPSEKQTKLFDSMLNYGGSAQNNFDYNTDRLANETYYGIKVHNGKLHDGFSHGRFHRGEKVVITPNEKVGFKFSHWVDKNGIIISYNKKFEIDVNDNNEYTPIYKDITNIANQLQIKKEIDYDTTLEEIDFPTSISFENEEETVILGVTWDTTNFAFKTIGTKKLYATLDDVTAYETYGLNRDDIYMEITTLPYTFEMDITTGEYNVTGYYGTEEIVTIPSTFNKITVSKICAKAFNTNLTIKELIINANITEIEQSAIYSCDNIESITIPFTGRSASDYNNSSNCYFGYIFGATSYQYQNDLLPINLTKVKLCEGATIVGDYAFYNCINLESIEISRSVTSIGNNAFYNCTSLTNVYYQGTIEDWCDIAFYYFYGQTSNPMYYAQHIYMLDKNNEYYEVKEIEIPSTITKINNYQFTGFNFTSITIPSNVISIGRGAFSNCASLTSIEIPSNVTSIEEYAFSNCSSLTNITIPSSVTSIEDYTFESCTSLTNIEIPSSITSIGDSAFRLCSSLTSIIIPNDVTNIESWIFYNCTSLTSITIPSSITTVGTCSFSNCTSLTNVYYQGTIEDWCNILFTHGASNPMGYAQHFYMLDENGEYYEVTEIEIPETITTIGDYQFQGFNNLTSIIIPSSVRSIGGCAFENCTSLTSITALSGVESIGSYAFSNCTSLESITILSGVTSIGHRTFDNCTSLTSITIPSSIESIEYYAFGNCSSLTNVYYQGTIEDWCNITFTSYASNPMYYAQHFYMLDENGEYYEVTEIEIPETITKIGDYQLYGFNNVTSIIIPSSITSIGEFAFYNCRSLESIIIPSGVESIGSWAFSYCTSLTSIIIPSSVTSIGSLAFFSCASLESITIPSSVTSIGENTFEYCTSLESITIPSSITSIETNTFSYCHSLTNIYYEGTIEGWCNITFGGNYSSPMYYDYHPKYFYMLDEKGEYYEVTEIVIPDTITTIGNYQFEGFNNVTSITISSSVTKIFSVAFSNCRALETIIIPNSVIMIGQNVFSSCSSLKNVYYTGTEEQWNEIAINEGNTYLTNATIIYEYYEE